MERRLSIYRTEHGLVAAFVLLYFFIFKLDLMGHVPAETDQHACM